MLIETEIPTQEVLRQMLECNSLQYILHTLAVLDKHPNPEEWSNECVKLFIKNNEQEETWVE